MNQQDIVDEYIAKYLNDDDETNDEHNSLNNSFILKTDEQFEIIHNCYKISTNINEKRFSVYINAMNELDALIIGKQIIIDSNLINVNLILNLDLAIHIFNDIYEIKNIKHKLIETRFGYELFGMQIKTFAKKKFITDKLHEWLNCKCKFYVKPIVLNTIIIES